MRAIIIPLNEYFYNYQKYDGKNPVEGFIYRRKWLYNFIKTKFGKKLLLAIIVYPLVLFAFLFFFGPFYLYHLLLSRKNEAMEKADLIFDALDRWTDKITRKDIIASLSIFERNEMNILVYFNDEMIPAKPKERDKFFQKPESMKQGLKVHHVFEANKKEDVEDVIQRFNINPNQSFFMSDGKIDLNPTSIAPGLNPGQWTKYSTGANQ